MNCDQMQEQLADYLGNELDAPQRESCDEHLASCGDCRREVAALTDTIQKLDRLEAPPVRIGDTRPNPLGRLQPLAYAAVLMIGLCLGWWVKPMQQAPFDASGGSNQVQQRPSGIHDAWIDAAMASSGGDAKPFARNALRLARAFAGQG